MGSPYFWHLTNSVDFKYKFIWYFINSLMFLSLFFSLAPVPKHEKLLDLVFCSNELILTMFLILASGVSWYCGLMYRPVLLVSPVIYFMYYQQLPQKNRIATLDIFL